MPKPLPSTHPSYFKKYIDLVSEEDLMIAFKNQQAAIDNLLKSVTEEKAVFAYAPNKWTLKELLQHIIDTERIFAFRSLCFARKETEPLPGFDENTYAANSNANLRTWKDLCNEFLLLRKSTEILFASFTPQALHNLGIANNNATSVISMGFTAIGHVYHHINIINQKYLA